MCGTTPTAPEHTIVARFAGEVALKATNARRRFRRRLEGNIKDALARAGVRFDLRRESARFVVTVDAPRAADVLCRVFGVGSVSPVAATCPAEPAAIVEIGAARFADAVRGRRFAVRARTPRGGPSSRALERDLGAILARHGRVDLTTPEVTIRVEVAGGTARLSSERRAGAGGLPLGTAGRAIALVSGGFDSTVAAWRAMRRGLALDLVFANPAGREHERAVLAVLKVLCDGWAYGTRPRAHVLPAAGLVEAIRSRVRRDMAQVAFKGVLYDAAAAVAAETGAEAIVTGEALGQVASQTLPNPVALDARCPLTVLRPLIGADKGEIVARTRTLGLHDLIARVPETCDIAGRRPVVRTSASELGAELARLGGEATLAALGARRVVDLTSMPIGDVAASSVTIDRVPRGALIVDLRDAPAGGRHAVVLEAGELLRGSVGLPLDRTLVVVCEVGARSAAVAEALRRRGHDAYALTGGGTGLALALDDEPGPGE